MKKFQLGKNALFFSILTLITVITWIAIEVYSTVKKTTIPKVTQEQMTPLESKIEKEVVTELKEDLWFSEEELNNFNFPVSSESSHER